MKSKIYSSDYIKSSSKGQIWIPSFLMLGFFMVFPVMELMMLGNWFGTEGLSTESIRLLYEALWTDGFMAVGFVMAALAAAVNAVSSFWYLYSSRKIDFYHSLPVKRSAMFWHKAFIGILYYLIPYVIMEFLAVCIGALRGFFSLKIVGMALLMFLMHILLYLMIYFSVVLVICVTGNMMMGMLCLGGLYLYGPVLGCLLYYYRSMFYDTSYRLATYGFLKFLDTYASPYLLGDAFLEAYSGGDYFGMLVILLAVTGVLGLLSYMAYIRRPSESAGKSIVYSWIGVVVKFMVVIPCGLGTGFIFQLLQYRESQSGWWIFGMVLGTILSHGIIEVMYQMDFRKFVSKKHHLVLAGVMVAVCAVIYRGDLLHFDSYIPEQEELAALNIDFSRVNWEGNYPVIENKDGTYWAIDSWNSEKAAITKEGGVGTETWKILEEIVAAQERENQEDNAAFETGKTTSKIPMKYTLKSGREIYREYRVTTENLYALRKSLYEEGRLKEYTFSFLDIEADYLKDVQCIFSNGDAYSLFQNDSLKYRELLDALRADLEEASSEDFLDQPLAKLWLEYKLSSPPDPISVRHIGSQVWYGYYDGSVFVYPTFRRTLAILEETGYPMSMDEIEVDDVEIIYYNEENYDRASVPVTYQKKEEIEALKKALISPSLQCYWMDYESSIEITVNSGQASNSRDRCMVMRSDLVPDFVKEMYKKMDEGLIDLEPETLPEAETDVYALETGAGDE